MFRNKLRRFLRLDREAYGTMSAEERLELDRTRDDLGATRGRGLEETWGRGFDHRLDAEEGRPPR